MNSGITIKTETDDKDSKFVNERRSNVKSDLIEITEDKLENILLKYLSKLRSRQAWITPGTLLLSVLLAQASAEFREALSVKANVWQAFFLLVTITSAIWFVISLVRVFISWGDSSIENLIMKIKNAKEQEGN